MEKLVLSMFEKKSYGNGYDFWFERIDDAYPRAMVFETIVGTADKPERLYLEASTKYPLYVYGLEQLYKDDEHGYGYIWSSRCGVVNKHFGTSLVEVVVGCTVYGMDVNDLLQYLPKGYKFVKRVDGEDVVYDLKKDE